MAYAYVNLYFMLFTFEQLINLETLGIVALLFLEEFTTY